uniref:Uncharacterized protein n=1 Tax=Tetranychus urticae TaxID=32264 RepID=T1KDP4_TETUR
MARWEPRYGDDPNIRRYDLFITLDSANRDRMHFDIHMCDSCYDGMLNMVEEMIASSTKSSDLNLLQYHLRSESSECKKSINQLCFVDGNTIASFDAKEKANVYESIYEDRGHAVKH